MTKLLYCILLLFILSGMYFIIAQNAEELLSYLLSTAFIAVVMTVLILLVRKSWNWDAFATTSFFTLLIIGLGRLLVQFLD